MSKKALVQHLSQKYKDKSFDKAHLEDVVDTFFLHLAHLIVMRKDVTCSKFGRFKIRKTQKRRVRHPQTGQWIEVPSKKNIVFYPSKVLQKHINQAFEAHTEQS